jgi:hypothetical protein
MRARAILGLAVVAVFFAAVPAVAGEGSVYEGTLHQTKDRPITVTVRHRRLQGLDVKARFDCEDEADSGVYTFHYRGLNERFREGRRFTYDRYYGEPQDNHLLIKGRIEGSGEDRIASGRLIIHFRSPHADQWPDCYTRARDGNHGYLRWRAPLTPE